MKDLKARFELMSQKYPNHGDYFLFGRAIEGTGMQPDTLRRWFNKLVSKEEYEQKDKRDLFEHLYHLANVA